MDGPPIEARRLTKHYGSSRGITEVDLVVERGEIFGFLGPNGAGKTTFIRTVLDFLRPTSGSVRVFGLDSREQSVAIHRRVSYLPGELALYERLTAREHLRWLGDLAGGVSDDRIETTAKRFSLDLDRPIRQLSKGNRQKVGLCQVFMRPVDLLILDEPTGGLDPLVQQEFQRAVREVASEGRTVFLSSHVLDEVQHLTHRVAILREGRVVAVESVESVRDRAVRRVRVRVRPTGDADASSAISAIGGVEGVRDVRADGDELAFTLDGSLDPLIKTLARYEIVDLVSEPLDLEEEFMRYYEDQT